MRKPKRSSDTDVPSKLQITSLGSAVWQDFVSASHAGTILLVESIIGRKCEYRHTTAGSYVVPVLDFEQFTKPHLVDDRVWHELNIEASQLQMDGKLPLPHPRCVFLFRRQETRFNPSALDLNFIHATKEGVLGVSVSRMISDSEQPPFNRWVLMPVQFALENGNNSITCMSNANLDEISRNSMSHYTQKQAQDIRIALMMLKSPTILIEPAKDPIQIIKKATIH